MSERDEFLAIGFSEVDGTFRAPGVITLTPIGRFYQVKIAIAGRELKCVIAKIALMVTPPRERDIDPAALIGE